MNQRQGGTPAQRSENGKRSPGLACHNLNLIPC